MNIYDKMKFDIYECYSKGGGDHIIPKNRIKKMFTPSELKEMCGPEAKEITKGEWRYWAEEATNYKKGISI